MNHRQCFSIVTSYDMFFMWLFCCIIGYTMQYCISIVNRLHNVHSLEKELHTKRSEKNDTAILWLILTIKLKKAKIKTEIPNVLADIQCFSDYEISRCCQMSLENRSTLVKNLGWCKVKTAQLVCTDLSVKCPCMWEEWIRMLELFFKIQYSGKGKGTLPMESVWATRTRAESMNWEGEMNRKNKVWFELVLLKIMWMVIQNTE